jgi:hypothetical protein
MITSYCIIVGSTAALALVWRTLLLDHPRLLAFIESIPLLGGVLRCGFCAVVWLSLFATLFYNPLASWADRFSFLVAILISWFAVSAGVLFVRNLIACLMEGCGVLTELHRRNH